MRVIQTHLMAPSGHRTGHTCLGFFDLELSSNVRLYKIALLRMRDGRFRSVAPYAGKNLAATFSPALAERITALALDAFGEHAHAA
ncbi:hypothetical protein JP75_11575 [Devosia riboflavina]|uniref:SpoVG family protein n=1 Tax=Devosia riboflavina TaxID=46914 RepID=A0A087M283_9HYPH|nr:hypothetical protein [Devosia riboflavina]KFL30986.1 hypothetical protein JP75_11575 [Devosia riboflavina]